MIFCCPLPFKLCQCNQFLGNQLFVAKTQLLVDVDGGKLSLLSNSLEAKTKTSNQRYLIGPGEREVGAQLRGKGGNIVCKDPIARALEYL